MEDLQEKIDSIMKHLDSTEDEKEYAYVYFSVSYAALMKLGDIESAEQIKFPIAGLRGEIATDRGII